MCRYVYVVFLFFLFIPKAWAGPFTCTGDIYQVQFGQLRIFDPVTSSYVDIGPVNSSYNAIGFNTLDNYAYGSQDNFIIRIHADGTIENFMDIGTGSFSGDVDDNNTYWLRDENDANVYTGTNLSTGSQVTVTGVGLYQAVADVVFYRDGGQRYLIGVGNARTGIINLDTGVASRADLPGLPGGSYGAIWRDVNDRFFTFNNGTGQIFEIFDILSATPTAVQVAQGEASGSNDGFSCTHAPFLTLPPLAFDDDFTTPLDTNISGNVIADNGNGTDNDPEGHPITVTTTPVTPPNNGIVTLAANGDFTYMPNLGFFGTDSFMYYVADPSGLTATATVTIIVEKPEFEAEKNVEIYDPLSEGLYAIPGNEVVYTITVRNTGNVATDSDTMFLVDKLPPEINFFTGDFDGNGNPVQFNDSHTGLAFTYGTDVRFMNGSITPASFSDCTYAPVGSYDPDVNFICFNPKGEMAAGASGNPAPFFDVKFRARIE